MSGMVVSIIGPGGLGKTRLLDMAVDFEIVESFEHEAW